MNRMGRETVLGGAIAGAIMMVAITSMMYRPAQAKALAIEDAAINTRLEKLFNEHIAASKGSALPDVPPADASARAEVAKKELANGKIQSGFDYFNAAILVSQVKTTDEQMLAHELAGIAIAKGFQQARPLFARTMDGILVSLGHGERYGTQSRKPSNKVALSVLKELTLTAAAVQFTATAAF